MEAKNTVENGDSSENRGVGFAGDFGEEDENILKREISSHPLFGLLIEIHLNCLKVALGEPGELLGTTDHAASQANFSPVATTIGSSSELDRFMEAYCIVLGKLKEAMRGPQQETTSFIEAMYVQLGELSKTNPNNPKSMSPRLRPNNNSEQPARLVNIGRDHKAPLWHP